MARRYPQDRPRVSIGLPVFNGADYLVETIDSILCQTFTDFELIICDNASTDHTGDICKRSSARDKRIVYVRQPENRGAAVNYNHTFELARGEYFKWAAHDDVLAPEYLARCVEALDGDPGCVLVHPGTVIVDKDGNPQQCYLDYLACNSEDPVRRFAKWMIPADGMCNPVFGLVRRDVMSQTCLHGEYMGADRVFLAEIALRGRVHQIKQGLFLRRVHAGMSTQAHVDFRSLDWWYTGTKTARIRFKYWRRFGEFGRMLLRVRLSMADRTKCFAILACWALRRGDRLLRELMLPVYVNGRPTALARTLGQWLPRSRLDRGKET